MNTMNDNDISQMEKTIQEAHEVLYNRNAPLGKRYKGGEAGVNSNAWYGSNDTHKDNTWGNGVQQIEPNDDAQESDVDLSDKNNSTGVA